MCCTLSDVRQVCSTAPLQMVWLYNSSSQFTATLEALHIQTHVQSRPVNTCSAGQQTQSFPSAMSLEKGASHTTLLKPRHLRWAAQVEQEVLQVPVTCWVVSKALCSHTHTRRHCSSLLQQWRINLNRDSVQRCAGKHSASCIRSCVHFDVAGAANKTAIPAATGRNERHDAPCVYVQYHHTPCCVVSSLFVLLSSLLHPIYTHTYTHTDALSRAVQGPWVSRGSPAAPANTVTVSFVERTLHQQHTVANSCHPSRGYGSCPS